MLRKGPPPVAYIEELARLETPFEDLFVFLSERSLTPSDKLRIAMSLRAQIDAGKLKSRRGNTRKNMRAILRRYVTRLYKDSLPRPAPVPAAAPVVPGQSPDEVAQAFFERTGATPLPPGSLDWMDGEESDTDPDDQPDTDDASA